MAILDLYDFCIDVMIKLVGLAKTDFPVWLFDTVRESPDILQHHNIYTDIVIPERHTPGLN